MNLKHMTDECLILATKRLVRQERELLTTILHHFRELQRRRLFGRYSTLQKYAVGEFGYSEDQAQRRVDAMRLFSEVPEIEDKLNSGELNLTHVGIAASLFKNEKSDGQAFSREDKLEVFEAIAGKTTRAAERVVTTFTTVIPKRRDHVKPIGDGRNRVITEITDDTLSKIDRLKGLLAHKDPSITIGDLLERLCDIGLQQMDPARPSSRKKKPQSRAEVRRQIWTRDGGACVKCGSRFALQEDHIVPESMGGEYTFENIRLLCRSCNQRAAIEKLGLDKMDRYLSPEMFAT